MTVTIDQSYTLSFKLDHSCKPGDDRIHVNTTPVLLVGKDITIDATGQAETKTVTQVNGGWVTISSPLDHEHPASAFVIRVAPF